MSKRSSEINMELEINMEMEINIEMKINMELNLCVDNIVLICEHLYNKDIVQYLSTCESYHKLKDKVEFNYSFYRYQKRFVNISKIKDLWYYDRFSHVTMDCHIYNIIKFPICSSHVHIETHRLGTLDKNKPLVNYFHPNVTHLTINGTDSCFKPNLSPSNLLINCTHLVWYNPCDHTYLKDRIPSSVIDLTIKSGDSRLTTYNLPETIINLTVENWTSSKRDFIIIPKIKNTKIDWCDPD